MRYEWKVERAKLPGGLPPSSPSVVWAATESGLERDGELFGFPEVAREILRLCIITAAKEERANGDARRVRLGTL